jgi:hypothetical protein
VAALAELRAQGIIATSRRRLIIHDLDALHGLAAGSASRPRNAPAV